MEPMTEQLERIADLLTRLWYIQTGVFAVLVGALFTGWGFGSKK